ncbi:MAG: hypothetical protein COB66_04015 [Coxiella sp. (in: Bacteria)]|nr:MAG: hypothetical protein COB66_04015 [Coxiella sp. (in: g-proteobacteria)]
MNTQIMKRLFTLSALSISLLSASVVYAAVPSPTAAQEAEMIKQLKNLNQNVQVVGNRVQASAEAAIKSKYSLSGNSSITTSAMGNIAYQQNKDANSQNTVAATNADITTQLQPLSDKILETSGGMMDSDEISNRLINDMRLKKSLSIDIPGSDTPYSNNPLVVQLAALYPKSFPSWGLAKQDPQNGSFDFSSIIQPTAYAPGTAKEIAAGIAPAQQAQTTLAFLTTSYVNASNGLDLDTFQAKVAAASTKDKVSLYMQLMNDPKYQITY